MGWTCFRLVSLALFQGPRGSLWGSRAPCKPVHRHAMLIKTPCHALVQFICQTRSPVRMALVLYASKMPGFQNIVRKGQDGIMGHRIHGPGPTLSFSEVEMDSICFPQFLFNERALTHDLIGVCLGWCFRRKTSSKNRLIGDETRS